MSTQREMIKNRLLAGTKALGNTHVGLKDVCSALINDALKRGEKIQSICDKTFLSGVTIERMRSLKDCETGETYRPQVETCERILRAFGAELSLNEVNIKNEYSLKPKASSVEAAKSKTVYRHHKNQAGSPELRA